MKIRDISCKWNQQQKYRLAKDKTSKEGNSHVKPCSDVTQFRHSQMLWVRSCVTSGQSDPNCDSSRVLMAELSEQAVLNLLWFRNLHYLHFKRNKPLTRRVTQWKKCWVTFWRSHNEVAQKKLTCGYKKWNTNRVQLKLTQFTFSFFFKHSFFILHRVRLNNLRTFLPLY